MSKELAQLIDISGKATVADINILTTVNAVIMGICKSLLLAEYMQLVPNGFLALGKFSHSKGRPNTKQLK